MLNSSMHTHTVHMGDRSTINLFFYLPMNKKNKNKNNKKKKEKKLKDIRCPGNLEHRSTGAGFQLHHIPRFSV